MAVSSYRVSEHRHDKQYRYGVNSLASLQVNGAAGSGVLPRGSAVRAEALSPTGRRIPVDVVEKPDGTYSANFTPTESGLYSCCFTILFYFIYLFIKFMNSAQ